jgi:menaquinone-dependent protoporphyrinogen IX oxidase
MWIAEATKFLRQREDELAKAPVAYFIACIAMSSDTQETRKLAQGYVERPLKLNPRIKPVALGKFAGKVDYAKLPQRYHGIMRRIVPTDTDARNWEAIGRWADELARTLVKS